MGRGGGLDGKGIRCPHDAYLSDPRGPLVLLYAMTTADCRGIGGEGCGRRAESADCRNSNSLTSYLV